MQELCLWLLSPECNFEQPGQDKILTAVDQRTCRITVKHQMVWKIGDGEGYMEGIQVPWEMVMC